MVETRDHRGRMLRSELAGRRIAAGSKTRFMDVVKEAVSLGEGDEKEAVG